MIIHINMVFTVYRKDKLGVDRKKKNKIKTMMV